MKILITTVAVAVAVVVAMVVQCHRPVDREDNTIITTLLLLLQISTLLLQW